MQVASILSLFLEDTKMAQEAIQGFVAQYKPVLYSVLREGFDMYKELAANKKFFETQAAMKRNMYDAYIDVGFTQEQSMAFLLNADAARNEFMRKLFSALPTQQPTT
jgi:hypothetical protein